MPIIRSHRLSVRSLPLGFLGALVSIVAIERSIERNAIDTQGGNHWSYRIAAKVARAETGSNQVLCFGDSLLRLGLAPRVIQAETGLRGYNFAQAGGQAPGSYFLLRQTLEAGARPAAIVVEFFPQLLAKETKLNDENWPFFARLSDGLNLARYSGGTETFGRFAVRRILPSLRSRTSIRTAIQLALQTNERFIKAEILKAIWSWKTNRGAEITTSLPIAQSEVELDQWETSYFPPFHCLPVHRHYLHKFFHLAAQKGIPVFWLLPPYRPDLAARCDRSGFTRQHLDFVHGVQAAYPNVTVFDAHASAYPAEVFRDPHHLAREGAAVFSSDVGQALRRSLGAFDSPNRWVTLPPFQARSIPVPLATSDAAGPAVAKALRQGRVAELLR